MQSIEYIASLIAYTNIYVNTVLIALDVNAFVR